MRSHSPYRIAMYFITYTTPVYHTRKSAMSSTRMQFDGLIWPLGLQASSSSHPFSSWNGCLWHRFAARHWNPWQTATVEEKLRIRAHPPTRRQRWGGEDTSHPKDTCASAEPGGFTAALNRGPSMAGCQNCNSWSFSV